MKILALDLGKYKTVGCEYERESGPQRGTKGTLGRRVREADGRIKLIYDGPSKVKRGWTPSPLRGLSALFNSCESDIPLVVLDSINL